MDQVRPEAGLAFLLDSRIFIYKPIDMKILLIVVAIALVATFILMKKGKIQDADGNNIPDALEDAAKEVKEVVKKAKKTATKKKTTKE